MKNLLIAGLGLTLLTSCVKEQPVPKEDQKLVFEGGWNSQGSYYLSDVHRVVKVTVGQEVKNFPYDTAYKVPLNVHIRLTVNPDQFNKTSFIEFRHVNPRHEYYYLYDFDYSIGDYAWVKIVDGNIATREQGIVGNSILLD